MRLPDPSVTAKLLICVADQNAENQDYTTK